MLRILVMLSLVFVAGCSLKLGAEKLEMDAQAVRKVEADAGQVVVTSVRHDAFLMRKAFV